MPRWKLMGLLSGMLALGVAGCAPRNQFVPPPPPDVTVAVPVEREVVNAIEFTGTTRAFAKVDLRARVNGYLQKIDFEDGQMVKEGQLLFVIEQSPFKAELQAQRANLQKAQASLQLARANLARTQELFRRQVTTQQELDIQQAQAMTSTADVAAAQAAVDQAELNFSYTELRAPLSGRIGRHLVDRGNLVQAEQTLLASIESIDPIYAYFYLSERELLGLMEMLRLHEISNPEERPPVLYLALANETGFPHKGYLDYRELGVDPTTGTVARRGVFANPGNSIVPGMFVRIRAPLGDPAPRLLVEERALGSDQRGDFVLVVDKDNTVEYRPVKLGIAVDGLRVVEQGLSRTDRVVVNGVQRARPGAKVNPKMAEPAKTAPPAQPSAAGQQPPPPTREAK